MDVQAITQSLTHISIAWVVIGIFFALVALDTMRNGPSRGIALSIALPLSITLYSFLPKTFLLGAFVAGVPAAFLWIVFAALALALFILVSQMTESWGAGNATAIGAIVVALATTAIALVTWVAMPALLSLWHLGQPLVRLFGEEHRLYVILAAYVALAFARR